jgi:hypothetical protein
MRQMRGIAPAQIPGAQISVCHGVGGMFAARQVGRELRSRAADITCAANGSFGSNLPVPE